jgi:hypothetical protein
MGRLQESVSGQGTSRNRANELNMVGRGNERTALLFRQLYHAPQKVEGFMRPSRL